MPGRTSPQRQGRNRYIKGQRLAVRWSERTADACRSAARIAHLSRTGEMILAEATRLAALLGKEPTYTAAQLGRSIGAHRRTIEVQMKRLVDAGYAALTVAGDRGRGLASVWAICPCGPTFAALSAEASRAAENARSAPLPLPVGERYRELHQPVQSKQRQYTHRPALVPLAPMWEPVVALLPGANRRGLASVLRDVALPVAEVKALLEKALVAASAKNARNPVGYALSALRDPVWREKLLVQPSAPEQSQPTSETTLEVSLLGEAGIARSVLETLPVAVQKALPHCLSAARALASKRCPRSVEALTIHLLRHAPEIREVAHQRRSGRASGPFAAALEKLHERVQEPFAAWSRIKAKEPAPSHAGYLAYLSLEGEARANLIQAAVSTLTQEAVLGIEADVQAALQGSTLVEGSLSWKRAWRVRHQEAVFRAAGVCLPS